MGDVLKGDYNPPNLSSQTARILKSLITYGPRAASTMQDIQEAIAPREEALNLGLLQKYAPQFSQIGSQIAGQQQQSAVGNDLAALQGPGQQLIQSATAADRMANPEFYAQREAVNKGYQSLLGGMDPNKLTGAEIANVERGVNRQNAATGNVNIGDSTTTAANALQFDDRLQAKRQNFEQALNLFPGISSASRGPLDTFSIGTGRGAISPNIGTQNYGVSNSGQQMAQSFLPGLQQTQSQIQDINAGRRTVMDYVGQAWQQSGLGSATGAAAGKGCCFILISCLENEPLPHHIRFCRDWFYEKYPEVRRGYKKMSRWLVPLIKRFWILRKIIKLSMFYPLSLYGKWLIGESKIGWIMKPIKNFWFNIWRKYGSV